MDSEGSLGYFVTRGEETTQAEILRESKSPRLQLPPLISGFKAQLKSLSIPTAPYTEGERWPRPCLPLLLTEPLGSPGRTCDSRAQGLPLYLIPVPTQGTRGGSPAWTPAKPSTWNHTPAQSPKVMGEWDGLRDRSKRVSWHSSTLTRERGSRLSFALHPFLCSRTLST